MFVFKYLVVSFLFAAFGMADPAISNQDTPCLSACGKWSEVVATCYQVFTITPHTNGDFFSQGFLACLCTGRNTNGTEYGNATMTQVAGVCQSCSTTPNNIKTDLSTFLGLCAIQASNGSAANASSYAPLGYKTGEDANPDLKNSARAVAPGTMLGAAAVLLTGALAVL
ncbi:hypothetical protein CcaverHIS002_0308340 [Cutaneotrichosporon cavernicola]|uniref:Uncharacterized protein n=1 Tax=Cutaneotrichosporon cavernicola TaxID=279322 RepID=A0AA48IFS3_9TREE|nr:uncharacterized protein CcaverHIS019_0308210 [Cutaneotrichosporon cavernicola]BEI82966.1 hypothetical protein CcaverHIS002_0308340 [Cutaneotrichosporon cavernicola]BEI90751.1 hypothetical protein CcaverHIS019_0308210 [Cutaneotrichosporon cavernicola]BEI98531.1 hypothetical protein CcaverHIS631_0308300 [Cutaneotrichosporon cavernicola]BEJ06302.1 hypothetical protein CcaverHIS641_0308240 [Cutaneotrichosporon cavernicola]